MSSSVASSPASARPPALRPPSKRQPAPALFVGPPSHNASTTSLSLRSPNPLPPPSSSTRPNFPQRPSALSRERSYTSPQTSPPPFSGGSTNTTANPPSTSYLSSTNTASPKTPGQFRPSHRQTVSQTHITAPNSLAATLAGSRNAAGSNLAPLDPSQYTTAQRLAQLSLTSPARVAAQWAEAQSTLAEVDLGAANAAHAFGPRHAAALEHLRSAQVALASAWARGEGEDVSDNTAAAGPGAGAGSAGLSTANSKTKPPPPTRGSMTSSAGEGGRSQLEEETAEDIVLARQRREANDRYFARVNANVREVIGRLSDVAKAMRGVEEESREIWGDTGTIDTRDEGEKVR